MQHYKFSLMIRSGEVNISKVHLWHDKRFPSDAIERVAIVAFCKSQVPDFENMERGDAEEVIARYNAHIYGVMPLKKKPAS